MPYFFQKLRKISQNLSSDAVVIAPLMVNNVTILILMVAKNHVNIRIVKLSFSTVLSAKNLAYFITSQQFIIAGQACL